MPVIPVRGEDHLKGVIDGLPAELSNAERRVAVDFVREYEQVFSRDEFDIGRTNLIPHRIDTGDNRPFRQALRRHPLVHEQYIDETVVKLLENDLIEPAASPWASNVLLAKKADGSLRLCLDYRQLNNLTHKDSYPLPRISSCLDALGVASYFSTLDLRSGFWQTAMDPRDADKTAFITRKGQFRFKVLSFGLAKPQACSKGSWTLYWPGCPGNRVSSTSTIFWSILKRSSSTLTGCRRCLNDCGTQALS